MNTLMRLAFMTLLVAFCLSASAQDRVGGGGDGTEIQVDEIRFDILSWIRKGGHRKLELPEGITAEEYERKMKVILAAKKVVVTFVEDDDSHDPELKVLVDGLPKTCRGFISEKDRLPHMLCHIGRFRKLDEGTLYRLIHHEYAGLVGLERNDGAASDYAISRQLDKFLEKVTVLRLALKGGERSCGIKGSIPERIRDCGSRLGSFHLITKFVAEDRVYKVYQGPNGLIWSAPLPDRNNGLLWVKDEAEAEGMCKDELTQAVALPGIIWEVPSKKQVKRAERVGLLEILGERRVFWTSSTKGIIRKYPLAYIASGDARFVSASNFGYHREAPLNRFAAGIFCVGKSR